MFSRLEKIIGNDNLNKIKNTTVLVVGVGGVGGYVVEGLARSGIENIILIDHDTVDITNKNRQIIALDSTAGKNKVDVFKDRLLDINSNINVTCLKIFLDSTNVEEIILKYKPDYVVDACDTITTKKALISTCLNMNIFIISSMGTGNKLDPSLLQITDIRKTNYDPLARILRKWVKDEKIKDKIMVLWSSEKPIKTHDRTPGSTSFVPSSAGLLIASYIVRDIIR